MPKTFEQEHVRCNSVGELVRWTTTETYPADDAAWDEVTRQEDGEEIVAFAHQDYFFREGA